MTQFVQHISGQGEAWQVHNETFASSTDAWCVRKPLGGYHYLPKSEYILCDPPEKWEECTRELLADDLSKWREIGIGSGKRFAWRGDAIVIERRQS